MRNMENESSSRLQKIASNRAYESKGEKKLLPATAAAVYLILMIWN